MKAYKERSPSLGVKAWDKKARSFILNLEELATVWHFPLSHVKTPLIQKSATKRAEPPAGLPIENVPIQTQETSSTIAFKEEKGKKDGFDTDSGDIAYGIEGNFG
ncbi:MAG: hypothetical protein HOJ29_00825 [Candidatus Magasanikbacteria bacterium]|nr:hypothetical protein [Candidatus Magasanikbacteria bacterium]